jgi:hypothetical protein
MTRTMLLPKIKGLFLSLSLSVGLLGCNPLTFLGLASSNSVSISQLSPETEGSVIYLQGKVTDHAPFLGKGAYQLTDETGHVWVLTDDPLPPTGTEMTIRGTVNYQSIPVGNQEVGEFYLVEVEKLSGIPENLPQDIQPVSDPQPEVIPQPETPSQVQPQPKPKPLYQDLFLPHKQNGK